MDSGSDDLIQTYALNEEQKKDPATKEWCKLIDLDTVIEPEIDWHSTRTFELFLDALDVNQFVIKDDKRGNPKTNPKHQTTSTNKASPNNEAKDKIVTDDTTRKNGSVQKIPNSAANRGVDTYQGVETILSAEALKILSELPNLSHMSATRSFIFPTHKAARK